MVTRCRQWRKNWHLDNFKYSVLYLVICRVSEPRVFIPSFSQFFLAWSSIVQSVCEWAFSQLTIRCLRRPRFESCIQQRKTTCLLSIRILHTCTRASKWTTNYRKSYLITVTSHESHDVSNQRKLTAKENFVFPCRWPFVWEIRWSMANDAENCSYSWGPNESII